MISLSLANRRHPSLAMRFRLATAPYGLPAERLWCCAIMCHLHAPLFASFGYN